MLRQYVEGKDPITGRPLMPQVVDALTKPLTEPEKHPVARRGASRPRLLSPDTEENLRQLFLESDWTDGLPIVPPSAAPVVQRITSVIVGVCEAMKTWAISMAVATAAESPRRRTSMIRRMGGGAGSADAARRR